jgi:hypothetical protein
MDNAWDNAPVPHSIFYMKDGHAIHGSYEVKHLGKARHVAACDSRRSNNALHAGREDGTEDTQVVLAGDTPGGEAKVANSASSRTRHSHVAAIWIGFVQVQVPICSR